MPLNVTYDHHKINKTYSLYFSRVQANGNNGSRFLIVELDILSGLETFFSEEDDDQFPTGDNQLSPNETDFIFEKVKEARVTVKQLQDQMNKPKEVQEFTLTKSGVNNIAEAIEPMLKHYQFVSGNMLIIKCMFCENQSDRFSTSQDHSKQFISHKTDCKGMQILEMLRVK